MAPSNSTTSRDAGTSQLPAPPEGGYHAFISYSHADDRDFAKAIHFGLETFAAPFLESRVFRIFLDDASLPMTDDLWEEIHAHVVAARYLIVLLSPSSARSEWVQREVDTFLSRKGNSPNRVGLILTNGKCRWVDREGELDPAEIAVNPRVAGLFEKEPFVIDVRPFRGRWQRWRRAKDWDSCLAAVASKVADVPKDEIFGQHISHLRRRLLALAGLSLLAGLASLATLGFALQARSEARRALSSQLAAEARLAAQSPGPANGYMDRAALLAVQSYRTERGPDSADAMLRVLEALPETDRFLFGDVDDVLDVTFDRKGSTLVAVDRRRHILRWTFAGLGSTSTSIDLGGFWTGLAGSVAASCGPERIAVVYDKRLTVQAIDGGQTLSDKELSGVARAVACSADGSALAVSFGNRAEILRVQDLTQRSAVSFGWEAGADLALNADGTILAIGNRGTSAEVAWYSTDPSRSQRSLGGCLLGEPGKDEVTRVAFSPSTPTLLAATTRGLALHLLRTDGQAEPELLSLRSRATRITFSPSGELLAAGLADGSITVWNLAEHRSVHPALIGHAGPVGALTFDPEGRRLVSAGRDEALVVWEVAADSRTIRRWPAGSAVNAVAFGATGDLVLAGTEKGEVIAWNTATGLRRDAGQHGAPVLALESDGLGDVVISAGYDRTLRRWNSRILQEAGPRATAEGDIDEISLSADGKRLAIVAGRRLAVWTIGREAPDPIETDETNLQGVWLGGDGSFLALRSGGVSFRRLNRNLRIGRRLGQDLKINVHLYDYSQNPAARSGLGIYDHTLILFDIRRRRPVARREHGARIVDAAYSPDGKRVISASADGALHLWNAADLAPIGPEIKLEQCQVTDVAFSQDGRRVAAACMQGDVVVWDVSEDRWIEELCRLAGRNLTLTEWQAIGGSYERTCVDYPSGPEVIAYEREYESSLRVRVRRARSR